MLRLARIVRRQHECSNSSNKSKNNIQINYIENLKDRYLNLEKLIMCMFQIGCIYYL